MRLGSCVGFGGRGRVGGPSSVRTRSCDCQGMVGNEKRGGSPMCLTI
jgi:hypothetical protein